MPSFLSGFSLGLSLILAIGAQNAFVLKHGLKKQHVFLVCFICATSDALLITAGVSGFGAIIKAYPSIELFARYGGAVFLTIYALRSFISAMRSQHSLSPSDEVPSSISATIFTCLAFTWLNPHVYLDTVVLLGSISTQYEATKLHFGAGAVLASFTFFFALGYGARVLIPIFRKPSAWKVLDFIIGLVMLSIAATLVFTRA